MSPHQGIPSRSRILLLTVLLAVGCAGLSGPPGDEEGATVPGTEGAADGADGAAEGADGQAADGAVPGAADGAGDAGDGAGDDTDGDTVVDEEAVEEADPLPPIPIDREWDVLQPADAPRDTVRQAGEALGGWTIDLAGVEVDGPRLVALADTAPDEPFLRVVREELQRPVDLDDFLLFLDDVLAAGEAGRRGEPFNVGSGRARSEGILLHPDDVFKGKPRRYGRSDELNVDTPPPQESYEPAEDGDPPGPEWTMRYRNPATAEELYAALAEEEPTSGYGSRIASLLAQIEQQGGITYIGSTVRHRERGYLMWGAFVLSRAKSEAEVKQLVAKLDARNREWGLDVPITWMHPDGWEATVEGARQMADAYDVVYATESGARNSNHYGGDAADFAAFGLPRELTLHAPDGAVETFDLSDPNEPRDLSLTPRLIDWVEAHFGMRKLNSDYPHWNDTGI